MIVVRFPTLTQYKGLMSDTNDRASSPVEHRHADTLRRLSDRVAEALSERAHGYSLSVAITLEEMEAIEWARLLVDGQNRVLKVVKR